MKNYKAKAIIGAIIITVLAAAFWWGGDAPGLRGWSIPGGLGAALPEAKLHEAVPAATVAPAESSAGAIPENSDVLMEPAEAALKTTLEPTPKAASQKSGEAGTRPGGAEGGLTAQEKLDLAAQMAGGAAQTLKPGDAGYSQSQGMNIDPKTGKDQYLTDPVPKGKPVPVEPQNAEITDKAYTCILSVQCDTILKNIDWLDPEKVELVPRDGIIFAKTEVTFYEGESVFNVLLREMKKNRIHMEFVNTPMYNSAYIEGIANLYEFDCGELSGWMYKVNGWFPNYGCSRYQLKQGDVVEWVYTCDLGIDVGGYQAIGG
ncbi:MAG TPA: DUF4430 domain-containing protein [Negativicutes bacterium]|nr:DUF4430 domain-containing protein [Negativicutes bacterium]